MSPKGSHLGSEGRCLEAPFQLQPLLHPKKKGPFFSGRLKQDWLQQDSKGLAAGHQRWHLDSPLFCFLVTKRPRWHLPILGSRQCFQQDAQPCDGLGG